MTSITVPQSSSDSREVVRSIDSDGNLVFDQVGFQELDFSGVFGGKTTSSTENSIGYGVQTYTLDEDDGKIITGCRVQITSLDDTTCYQLGIVTGKDTTATPSLITVVIDKISALVLTSQNWEIQVVNDDGADSDLLAYSSTSVEIDSGTKTFTIQTSKFFPIGGSVLVTSMTSTSNRMIGTVSAYNSTTLTLSVPSSGTFGSGTYSSWSLYLLAGPSPGLPTSYISGLRVYSLETSKQTDPSTLPTGIGRGVSFNPTGTISAVAHDTSPYVTFYDMTVSPPSKLSNPATLPTGNGYSTSFNPDGTICAVTNIDASPYVTFYDMTVSPPLKMTNPVTLPTGPGTGVAFNPTGTICAVSHGTSPYVTFYDMTVSPPLKMTNPVTLPTGNGNGVAFSASGFMCAVAHATSPFVTFYDMTVSPPLKISNPVTLPPDTSYGAAFNADNTICAISHNTTPFVSFYDITVTPPLKMSNPATLPAGLGQDVTFNDDGTICAVVHNNSPFVTFYDMTVSPPLKMANPNTLPSNTGIGVAFNPLSTTCAVAHQTSPYITFYNPFGPVGKIGITSGSVRSYDNTVDLVFPSTQTKFMTDAFDVYNGGGLYVLSSNLSGTVSSSGTSVTGTSTSFESDFGSGVAQAYLIDYDTQADIDYRKKPIITTADGVVTGITSVSSDTVAVTDSALTASADTYQRGGYATGTYSYGIGVVSKDTDGSVAVFMTSLTGSGSPDVPSGYSHPRIIAIVEMTSSGISRISQPLNPDVANQIEMESASNVVSRVTPGRQHFHPAHVKALWIGTVTTNAQVSGNISSVDTATEIITWSTTHGLSSGQIIKPNGGTWPTGVTRDTYYYANAASTTTFTLHTTYADAIAGTNKVNLTAAGSGTRTMNTATVNTIHSFGINSLVEVQTAVSTIQFRVTNSGALSATTAAAWRIDGNDTTLAVNNLSVPASTTISSFISTGNGIPTTSTTSAIYSLTLLGDLA